MIEPIKKKTDNRILLKYAGLGMQFFIGLGAAVYIGLQIDKWVALKTPLAVWLLPLLFIAVIIYKIIKDTSTKK